MLHYTATYNYACMLVGVGQWGNCLVSLLNGMSEVVFDQRTGKVDYDDASITENTRVSSHGQ